MNDQDIKNLCEVGKDFVHPDLEEAPMSNSVIIQQLLQRIEKLEAENAQRKEEAKNLETETFKVFETVMIALTSVQEALEHINTEEDYEVSEDIEAIESCINDINEHI